MSIRNPGVIMGILNVTPDSFSDGGRYADVNAAVLAAEDMVSQGAQIIDVGGESTRPGAERIPVGVELDRVLPVIKELVSRGMYVSIDTMHAQVAHAAVDAGASMINDVSGGLSDPAMLSTAAELNVPIILMHWRGPSKTMQENIAYTDVVQDVRTELQLQVDRALEAGINKNNIILDPGIGFGKTFEHNWELLHRIDELQSLGFPLLVGVSRKRFLGHLLVDPDGNQRSEQDRDVASAVMGAHLLQRGVWGVRVHDVKATNDAIKALNAINPNPAMDTIEIFGVRDYGYHGVLQHERENGQYFSIDATLGISIAHAAQTDNLADTVNYAEVSDAIRARITGEPVDLIEKLAESIASDCLKFPQVVSVKVKVHKPDAPIEGDFGDVVVSRYKHR
jgi:dihydropteroate synthase